MLHIKIDLPDLDLISMSAKEKLDKVVEYLGSHKEISKKEIMDIICEDEDIDFMV